MSKYITMKGKATIDFEAIIDKAVRKLAKPVQKNKQEKEQNKEEK